MPLYGHELTEEIDPFQAGLDFAVNLRRPRVRRPRRARRDAQQGRSAPRARGLGARRQAHRRAKAPRSSHGDADVGAGHQRHVLADAGTARSRWPTSSRDAAPRARRWPSTSAAAHDAARVVPLPFYRREQNNRLKGVTASEPRADCCTPRRTSGCRRRPRRRRQGGHRRHLGVRRRGADRPGVHRAAQGRRQGGGRASRSARSNRSRP